MPGEELEPSEHPLRGRVFAVDTTDPMTGAHIGKQVVVTHHPFRCEGRGCVVHHPSDHPLTSWPVVYRADKGFSERICLHGVGHPDPDDVEYGRSIGQDWWGVHGCDGCCGAARNAWMQARGVWKASDNDRQNRGVPPPLSTREDGG